MGKSEALIQSEVRLIAPMLGVKLMRNNSGACKDDTGRLIRYGLGNDSKKLNTVWKSPDLIGVLLPDGRFIGAECKEEAWRGVSNDREIAQRNAMLDLRNYGAFADFVTSVDDFKALIKGQFRWIL